MNTLLFSPSHMLIVIIFTAVSGRTEPILRFTPSGPPGGSPDANEQSIDAWQVVQAEGSGNGLVRLGDGTDAWQIFDAGSEGEITMTYSLPKDIWQPGRFIAVDFAHNRFIAEGRRVGIRWLDEQGKVLAELSFLGGNGYFSYTDAQAKDQKTPQVYAAHQVMTVAFLLSGKGTHQMSFNGHVWNGHHEGKVAAVQIFNDRAGQDSDMYVRELRVGRGTPLEGAQDLQ